MMTPGPEIVFQYFPDLDQQARDRVSALGELYQAWNAKINVVSRKDIDQLYLRHVLHSLAIAKVMTFQPGAHVLDLGTGGGFPGIPLSILFPDTHFHLIDGTGKKIKVCQAVIDALALPNCRAEQIRAEQLRGASYDFVVTRAVARIQQLCEWSFPLIHTRQQHALPNGLLALKGRQLKEEMSELPKKAYREEEPVAQWFDEEYFEEKAVVYVQR